MSFLEREQKLIHLQNRTLHFLFRAKERIATKVQNPLPDGAISLTLDLPAAFINICLQFLCAFDTIFVAQRNVPEIMIQNQSWLFRGNISIRYFERINDDDDDTRCYFNVRSKADMSQFNLPYGTDN